MHGSQYGRTGRKGGMRDQIGHHFCGRVFRLLRLGWRRGDGWLWLWLRWYVYWFRFGDILYFYWGGRRFGRDGKDDWFGHLLQLYRGSFPILRLGVDCCQNFLHYGSGDRYVWRFSGRRDRRRRNYRNLRRRHRSWCYCDLWGWRNFYCRSWLRHWLGSSRYWRCGRNGSSNWLSDGSNGNCGNWRRCGRHCWSGYRRYRRSSRRNGRSRWGRHRRGSGRSCGRSLTSFRLFQPAARTFVNNLRHAGSFHRARQLSVSAGYAQPPGPGGDHFIGAIRTFHSS